VREVQQNNADGESGSDPGHASTGHGRVSQVSINLPTGTNGVPILNASGCLDAPTAPDVTRALDAFVTKTVTPLPREGNPPQRIAEVDGWMLNSIGLQNPGIDAFVGESLTRLRPLEIPIWVSVGGFSTDDYALVCGRLDDHEEIAALELNLSCPNVDEAPESAAELVAAAREATHKPLFAKLSPALPDVAEAARAVVGAGADGLSLVNTIRGLALDPHTLEPRLALGAGGASGPPLRPIALRCVHACATAVDVPIVGMGGVTSGRDALELVAAGATAIALGTVLFSDPFAPSRVRDELTAELAALGVDTAAAIKGRALEAPSEVLPFPG
jgi:dihydroorotate dehydrogenase (NAD+) catalytic subunit